jgi:hypothetical protein
MVIGRLPFRMRRRPIICHTLRARSCSSDAASRTRAPVRGTLNVLQHVSFSIFVRLLRVRTKMDAPLHYAMLKLAKQRVFVVHQNLGFGGLVPLFPGTRSMRRKCRLSTAREVQKIWWQIRLLE